MAYMVLVVIILVPVLVTMIAVAGTALGYFLGRAHERTGRRPPF
jgi:hypothetical protein